MTLLQKKKNQKVDRDELDQKGYYYFCVWTLISSVFWFLIESFQFNMQRMSIIKNILNDLFDLPSKSIDLILIEIKALSFITSDRAISQFPSVNTFILTNLFHF
jgi:hypothetical protein